MELGVDAHLFPPCTEFRRTDAIWCLLCFGRDAMGIQRFEDLVAWQLAHQLSLEVFAATQTGPPSKDFRFRDQLRDSAASVGRNIAEGFGRSTPGDFARFLRYARGSLAETRNTLIEGRERRYLAVALANRLLNLASATDRLTRNLMLAKLRQAASIRASLERR